MAPIPDAFASNSDQLQRFVFDDLDARGCIVGLREACEAIQGTHYYPPALAIVLNQFVAAVSLLRDSIKIAGSVTMQLRGQGSISLIMADCMNDMSVRAIAEYDVQSLAAGSEVNFSELGEEAILAITITPDEGERYQAIVPIEYPTLEQCLEDYFARSEQLPTWFRLLADENQSVGIAIHALPVEKVADAELASQHFERLKVLLKSMDAPEALKLDSQTILARLFHAEACRLFEPKQIAFGCHCSREKSLDAIKALGKGDIQRLIKEQQEEGNDSLVVDCHFCFQRYEFEFDALSALA